MSAAKKQEPVIFSEQPKDLIPQAMKEALPFVLYTRPVVMVRLVDILRTNKGTELRLVYKTEL